MKRDPSKPLSSIENSHTGLISLAALEAAAEQLQTHERRYRVTIVSCDSASRPKQGETERSNHAAAVRR